jgi:hypothetical protein
VSDSIVAFRVQLRGAAHRRARTYRRRRHMALAALAVLAATVCTGITVAATGWFQASPAPPEVVEDFQSYTPQLGFHPQSRRAQLVARDGDFALYATTNREGTYCVVTSAPWLPPGRNGDGGVCVKPRDATEPIAAGITRMGRAEAGTEETVVVAGRVLVPGARAIRFATADGDPVERSLGAGGFFVAAVDFSCVANGWAPPFIASDADGEELARAVIPLAWTPTSPGQQDGPPRCLLPMGPHGPQAGR